MKLHLLFSSWTLLVVGWSLTSLAPVGLADGEKNAGIVKALNLKREAGDDDEKKESEKPEEKKGKDTGEGEKVPGTARKSAEGQTDTDSEEGVTEHDEPAPAAVTEKKEPPLPMFRLRDGTRVTGIPDVAFLNIITHYGKLVVPVADVERVRFATGQDRELTSRIAEHIRALGSEEFDRREEAMAALETIGVAALDPLRKALDSDDEEVKSRAEKIVANLEDALDEEAEETDPHLTPLAGGADEVVTVKFTVMGEIEERVFNLKTRYGTLTLNREHILSIVFRESLFLTIRYSVPGNTYAADDKWLTTNISLEKGNKLKIEASGHINLPNFNLSMGPEGSFFYGNGLKDFPTGALLGKIGEKGKPFLVGRTFEGVASTEGVLRLGVSMKKSQPSSDHFTVEVTTEKQP